MRSVRVMLVLVGTLSLGAPALAAPAVAAPVARAAGAAVPGAVRPTVVYGFGGACPPTNWRRPLVRPARAYFDLACEDGIRRIRWRYWHRLSAFGHGYHLQFNGTGFTPQRATITLSRVRYHDGRRYFSRLVMRWTAKNGVRHTEILTWRRLRHVGWLWL